MAKHSKNRNVQPRPDSRFITTVKVNPQAVAAGFLGKNPRKIDLEKQVQKLVPRAVRGVQYSPRIPVAQNNVKWSGKQMGNTKFSMFTKKTGLNTLMTNKEGKSGFRIPALIAILAIVIGGGGYWAYSSLSSTEWGRMGSGAEANTNKWLENVSTQRTESAPVNSQKTQATESYKTWGTKPAVKAAGPSHQSKLAKHSGKRRHLTSSTKIHGKHHLVKHSSKSHKGKKFVSHKKGKSSKFVKGKSHSKHKLTSAKKKRLKSKHVTMASAQK